MGNEFEDYNLETHPHRPLGTSPFSDELQSENGGGWEGVKKNLPLIREAGSVVGGRDVD
jgi:hypothetical protein